MSILSVTCARPVAQGSDPKEYGKQYEVKLRQAELESIEDYIVESKNLVTLHEQVRRPGNSVALCFVACLQATLMSAADYQLLTHLHNVRMQRTPERMRAQ